MTKAQHGIMQGFLGCFLFAATTLAADAAPVNLEQAAKIALQEVKDGRVLHREIDYDDGREYFEILVVDPTTVYEITINPATGGIHSLERETIIRNGGPMTAEMEAAKKRALQASGGGDVIKIEEDYEAGRAVFEIDIVNQGYKYELKIDKADGTIVEEERERLD